MLSNAHFLYSWYYNIWSYKLDNERGVGAENSDRHSPGSHVFATPQMGDHHPEANRPI